MRKKVIAGNWKMNTTPKEALELINSLKDKVDTNESEVIFCVPYVNLQIVKDALKGTNIKVGAQNVHFEDAGAYTGEISVGMLNEMGIEYAIIGHSERREYYAETNETVNKKAIKALANKITPIICVGETLEQREQGITIENVRIQTKIAYLNISKEDAIKTILAYEPVWAIGTGKTATSAQAEEVCEAIRKVLIEVYDQDTADKIRIQYGGSVSGANANELFNMPNIDGGLVGGSSLKEDFVKVVNYK